MALKFKFSLISHLPYTRQLQLLGGGALISFVAGVIAVGVDYRITSNATKRLEMSGNLVMLTQRLAKDAAATITGDSPAYEGLAKTRQKFSTILTTLDKGGDGLAGTRGVARKPLNELLTQWRTAKKTLDDLVKGRPVLVSQQRGIAIQVDISNQAGILASKSAPELTYKAVQISQLLEQVANSVQMLLMSATSEKQSGMDEKLLMIQNLLNEFSPDDATVKSLKDDLDAYKSVMGFISANAGSVSASHLAGKRILDQSEQMLSTSQDLVDKYSVSTHNLIVLIIMGVSALLMLTFLWLLFRTYLNEARHRAVLAEAGNKKNQMSILRLMNELSDLSEGDLTVRATVTEDMTGAIADSINYTAEELHRLVARITAASLQMGQATTDSEQMAQRLLISTQKQVSEIKDAEQSVQLISRSIGEVDEAATKAAEVGRHTLIVTHQGSVAVRNAIVGMDGIREHIQETSKRIKRLGESSQQISEIVDMISDITEQTNVLALNAAIQAASAGDAGRGFSVVAEEVQRLAERSADATKQIGSLVKTIQSDTHDAVAAMEKSTMGVVEGAKLTEMAGQSLNEIEQVSNELATLINSISVSTQVQTEMADEVAGVMKEILTISEDTTEGTRQTSESAAKLTSLAADLKGSVAGFKL
jgi:twitching motility protein PilJ